MWDGSKTVDLTGTMLDAGYLMLVEAERRSRFSGDIPEFARSVIQKHPDFDELSRVVSRIEYPGSRDIANGFHHNGLSPGKHFMELKG